MEWSDIRVFLQVVREGTMVGATAALRMDHSTISRRIARLEHETQVQLFERAGRRLALTREGELLAEAAEKLETIIVRDVLNLSIGGTSVAGSVRIGTTEEFGAHYLAPRLAMLTAAYPGLEIELVALPRTFSLASREVDLVVTPDRPTAGDVRYKKLTDIEFGIYGSPDYFADRDRPSDFEALSTETWCGYIPELLFTRELDLLNATSIEIPVRYRTTSVTAQLAAALGGYALAALPCFVASSNPDLERLVADEAVFERTYWLVVHEDLARYPRVRAIMSGIEAAVCRDRALFRPSAVASREPAVLAIDSSRICDQSAAMADRQQRYADKWGAAKVKAVATGSA